MPRGTLFWTPERVQRLREIAGTRPSAEVRTEFGVTASALAAKASELRISLSTRPTKHFGNSGRPKNTETLAADTARALIAEAERRGLTPRQLVTKMVELIVRDNMFAAVLDTDDDKQ